MTVINEQICSTCNLKGIHYCTVYACNRTLDSRLILCSGEVTAAVRHSQIIITAQDNKIKLRIRRGIPVFFDTQDNQSLEFLSSWVWDISMESPNPKIWEFFSTGVADPSTESRLVSK